MIPLPQILLFLPTEAQMIGAMSPIERYERGTAGGVILDLFLADSYHFAYTSCSGLEFWTPQKLMEQLRNFSQSFVCYQQTNDSILGVGWNSSPEIHNICRYKSCAFVLKKKARNSFVFD